MAKMTVNLTLTMDYTKNDFFAAQKQTQFKPNSCGFLLEFIPHRVYPELRCGETEQE